jgi:hypothetical protein
MNTLLAIFLRWTFAPIFDLMAWCLLVEQEGLQISPPCSEGAL